MAVGVLRKGKYDVCHNSIDPSLSNFSFDLRAMEGERKTGGEAG